VGVDTHADIHVAVVLSSLGALLGSRLVATTPARFGELVDWASGLAPSGASGWREPGATEQAWPDTLEPRAMPWWRWTAPIAGPGALRARATGGRRGGGEGGAGGDGHTRCGGSSWSG
jgi:pimeloyl-ACP methyl ester carboxylesterase